MPIINDHCVQASVVDELSVLNSLTKLRTLKLTGPAYDPRLDWLSLGHDVMVGTWCSDIAGTLSLQPCWNLETNNPGVE
jgi:hypothetical protein